jgi:hypothetical protein
MIVELTGGSTLTHSPVPYETYFALVDSRFPEKVYRHQVTGVIPVITSV